MEHRRLDAEPLTARSRAVRDIRAAPAAFRSTEEDMDTVLELENVSVHFDTPDGTVQAVRDVSLSLKSGETLAIVGESGCGKSVLCKSVRKLLPGNARISGKMLIDGKDIAP